MTTELPSGVSGCSTVRRWRTRLRLVRIADSKFSAKQALGQNCYSHYLSFVTTDELGVNSVDRRISLQEILDELPKLTEAERTRLQEELDAFSQSDERSWAEIAEERLRGIRAGEKKAIPAEEVFTKARNLIGE